MTTISNRTTDASRPSATSGTTASSVASTAAAPTPAPADADVSDVVAPTQTPAATFEGASAPKRWMPFNPPPAPKLIDESKTRSPEAKQDIREKNAARVEAYNVAYAAYLERYAEGVKSAPSLERVHHFGPPSSYAPTDNLPPSQRARYDELHEPRLAQQKVAYEALGDRVAKALGERDPGFYVFVEGKVSFMGQAYELRGDNAEGDFKASHALQFGVDNHFVDNDEVPGVAITESIDPVTKEMKTQLSVELAGVEVEADTDGRIAMGYGVGGKVGDAEGKLGGGSSYDAKQGRTEVYLKGELELGDAGVEGKAGVGFQFVSKEQVKRAIDSRTGFFDLSIAALRSGGR